MNFFGRVETAVVPIKLPIRAVEIMTPDAYVVAPFDTIAQAAILMREKDVGSVAVTENHRLVGILTDRDIALRAVAGNKGPATPVREIMSGAVRYCYDCDALEDIARDMAEQQIRRLPVVNRYKRLIGFISLGNIAGCGDQTIASVTLKGVATPH